MGLPLAVAFGRKFSTIGYDLSKVKVAAYGEGRDPTGEVSGESFRQAAKLECTTDPAQLAKADFIIISVPTPVDGVRTPDFAPLRSASEVVGKHMRRGATMVYESTVYPSATEEVCVPILERASGMKWNLLPFRPGLVGGHCIGVDPYYLTFKAEQVGYHPQVILAGRRINDGMGKFVAEQTVKQMIQNGTSVKGAKVNVLGLAFKENTPDLRNSRVIDVIQELRSYGIEVFVHDPVVSPHDAKEEYGIDLVGWRELPAAAATILAVAHKEFLARPVSDYASKTQRGGCLVDVKAKLDPKAVQEQGLTIWRL
ncbi:MAG: hypothetical protein O2979_12205 [Proteobacteria bacterium]|nr:hypothetical protein [Pseudomonadota bacterium]